MVGRRFSRLVVLKADGSTRWGERLWSCRCDCGVVRTVKGKSLRASLTRSCGCLAKRNSVTHGGRYTRLYRIWRGLRDRCLRPNSKDYGRYGGAGITVCHDWATGFASFRAWALSCGYTADLWIDRIDGRGPYVPSNCRWVTPTESNRHRCTVKLSLDSAVEIRARVAAGASHRLVAAIFGVSRASVSYVCEGRTWISS